MNLFLYKLLCLVNLQLIVTCSEFVSLFL